MHEDEQNHVSKVMNAGCRKPLTNKPSKPKRNGFETIPKKGSARIGLDFFCVFRSFHFFYPFESCLGFFLPVRMEYGSAGDVIE